MFIRNFLVFLPTVALSLALAALLLSTSFPALPAAWHVTTQWGELAVSDGAFYVWLVIAGLGVAGALFCLKPALTILTLPAFLLAFWVPDLLTMDSSLLSRQVALESMTAEIVSERQFDAEPGGGQVSIAAEKFGEIFFDTVGLEAFEAEVIPDSTAATVRKKEQLEAALGIAQSDLKELKTSLLELEIRLCDEGVLAFEGGLSDRLDQSGDVLRGGSVDRALNDLVQRCHEDRARIPGLETAVREKEEEIKRQKVELADLVKRIAAGDSARADEISARQVAVSMASRQKGIAGQTGFIAVTTFVIAALVMLFTASGANVLGFSFAFLVAGALLPEANFGPLKGHYFYVFMNAVAAFSVLSALYAFRLFLLHNAELWRFLSPLERRAVGFKALFYWSVPAILLAAGIIGSNALDGRVMDQLYDGKTDGTFDADECASGGRLLSTARGVDGDCAQRRLEADVERAIRTHLKAAQQNALSSVDELTDETLKTADWARKTATRVVDDTLPDKLSKSACGDDGRCDRYVSAAFDIQTGCDFWRIGCHFKNAVKHAASSSYDNTRKKTIATVESTLKSAEAVAGGSANVVKTEARKTIKKTVSDTITSLDRFSWSTFRVHDVFSFVAIFCVSIAILKSVGYVIIRVIHHIADFNERLARQFDVSEGETPETHSRRIIVSDNGNLTLPPGGTICVANSVAVQRRQSHLVLPIPSAWLFLKRLMSAIGDRKNANCFFSYYRTEPDDEDILLCTEGGRSLVAVYLEDGEVLAFDPSSFVGRSSTVRIKLSWGFRVTDLMAGRIRRPQVCGPGYVIFRTSGRVEIASSGGDVAQYIEVSRLVAWTPGIPYRLVSERGFGAMYLGTTDVAPVGNGIALGDGGRGARVAFGLSRAFLLLLPV